jgi:hypothetical protein
VGNVCWVGVVGELAKEGGTAAQAQPPSPATSRHLIGSVYVTRLYDHQSSDALHACVLVLDRCCNFATGGILAHAS